MCGGRKDVVTDANVGSKEKSTVETHNSHTFCSPIDLLSYHSHNVPTCLIRKPIFLSTLNFFYLIFIRLRFTRLDNLR